MAQRRPTTKPKHDGDQRMRLYAVERAKPPQSDPTGEHHAACRDIADEAGRDVVDVLEAFAERAAIRVYDAGMTMADAEAAAVEDVRTMFVKQSTLAV